MPQTFPKARLRSVAQCPPHPPHSEPKSRHSEKFPFHFAKTAKENAAAKRFDPQTGAPDQVTSLRFYQYFRPRPQIGQLFSSGGADAKTAAQLDKRNEASGVRTKSFWEDVLHMLPLRRQTDSASALTSTSLQRFQRFGANIL